MLPEIQWLEMGLMKFIQIQHWTFHDYSHVFAVVSLYYQVLGFYKRGWSCHFNQFYIDILYLYYCIYRYIWIHIYIYICQPNRCMYVPKTSGWPIPGWLKQIWPRIRRGQAVGALLLERNKKLTCLMIMCKLDLHCNGNEPWSIAYVDPKTHEYMFVSRSLKIVGQCV